MAIVLMVEHHDPVMIRARHLMTQAGLEAVLAASAEQMAGLCRERRADVAIVHEASPSAAESLSAQLKTLRPAPKVLLLSHEPPHEAAGADAHLYLPTEAEKIFGQVAALLSGG